MAAFLVVAAIAQSAQAAPARDANSLAVSGSQSDCLRSVPIALLEVGIPQEVITLMTYSDDKGQGIATGRPASQRSPLSAALDTFLVEGFAPWLAGRWRVESGTRAQSPSPWQH